MYIFLQHEWAGLLRVRDLLKSFWINLTQNSRGCYLFIVFAAFILGTPGQDVLFNTKTSSDYLYAKDGDDVAIYIPSLNKVALDQYDGGKGMDTLWLRVTDEEYANPNFQKDMIQFYYFLLFNNDVQNDTNKGPDFQFNSFHLKVRNFENIFIERMPPRLQKELNELPTLPISVTPVKDLFNSSEGNLA